jgi:UDP-N-acetylglucosamine--N-acetylmuramyl-(pentapeptide) pyrophosphoryl-undecaprenol N-acetylglucosamine transferase
VAEAWANRVACVFLPYPYHKDEHQRWNAEPLAAAGGAVIAKDAINATANAEGAGKEIAALMRDSTKRGGMRGALAKLGDAEGAAAAARRVMEMLRA